MTHDVTVSAAECAECKQDHRPDCARNQTVGHYGGGPADCNCGWRTLGQRHLQSQQSAFWRAAVAVLGDNPIYEILHGSAWLKNDLFADALRAQMEAKR